MRGCANIAAQPLFYEIDHLYKQQPQYREGTAVVRYDVTIRLAYAIEYFNGREQHQLANEHCNTGQVAKHGNE